MKCKIKIRNSNVEWYENQSWILHLWMSNTDNREKAQLLVRRRKNSNLIPTRNWGSCMGDFLPQPQLQGERREAKKTIAELIIFPARITAGKSILLAALRQLCCTEVEHSAWNAFPTSSEKFKTFASVSDPQVEIIVTFSEVSLCDHKTLVLLIYFEVLRTRNVGMWALRSALLLITIFRVFNNCRRWQRCVIFTLWPVSCKEL